MSVSVAQLPTYRIVKDTDADGTVERDVCAGPCRLTHIHVTNPNAGAVYLKLFDKVDPTVGTDAPDEIVECVGSGTEGGVTDVPVHPPKGLLFSTALSFACVTAGGTAGTTSPTSNVTVVLHVQPGSS